MLSVVLGVPGAYVLYRHSFRGRAAVRALVTVPFVLPTVVVGVAFRSLLVDGGPLGFLHLDGTFAAIVAALVFFNYAVVVRAVGGLWERLDPRAEQAARALGASPWRAFRTVTLPALTPAIASAASLAFLFCATAFGTVLVLGGLRFGTIETEIWVQTTQFLDLRAAAVLSVVQLVVVAGALTVAGRARSRRERALAADLAGRTPSARCACAGPRACRPATGTRSPSSPRPSPRSSWCCSRCRWSTSWSARCARATGWGLDNYTALGTTGGSLTVTVWQATLNSLRVALDATVIALVVGGLVALVVSRRPRRAVGRRAVAGLDALFMLPLGRVRGDRRVRVPAVDAPPVRAAGRPADQPAAGARSRRPSSPCRSSCGPCCRCCGPSTRACARPPRRSAPAPGRVLRTVDLSIAARSLGLAVGFAFAASLGEFGATSFLARPDRPTLPVVIFRLIGRPGPERYGMALAASVVLAVLTAGIVAACERLRAPGAGGEW